MGNLLLKPAPRRADEACLAIRDQVSPPHLRRLLPKRAATLLPPTPADELRELLKSPLLRSVYVRCAAQALADNDPDRIASELISVRFELAQRQQNAQQLHATYPLLFPAA